MTRRETLAALFAAALVPAALVVAANARQGKRPNAAWLRRASYGLFVHFLPGGAGPTDHADPTAP